MRSTDMRVSERLRWCVPLTLVLAFGTAGCMEEGNPTGPELYPVAAFAKGGNGGGGGGGGHESGAGNNLSFPTIWAEGVAKAIRGTMGTVVTQGEWWWWWGEAPVEQGDPLACAPDPDDNAYCNNNIPGSVGPAPGAGALKAYLQKDALNEWQATNGNATGPVTVDVIDWGDALEAVPWYLNSQVRIETTLYKTVDPAVTTEYRMLHTSGWGADEVWGLAVADGAVQYGPAAQATVFSPCARLTIQKLQVPREAPELATLEWSPSLHQWIEPAGTLVELVAPPFFNKAVHEAADGPGYYNAEVNVKGMVIFGYTWSVRQSNEGAGDYRLTFSFDGTCPVLAVNTFFQEGTTTILQSEEEVTILAEGDVGGTGVLDFNSNLTYIDVRILSQKGGGGNKGGRKN